MKNVIKLLAFTIAVLAVSILNGCTDFPDEYAVQVSIEEISLKDDAELSEDGKSYKATVLINFNIIQNSLNEISSAIVNINGENYDVKNQITASKGGVAEIPCTFKSQAPINVSATLTIAKHTFDKQTEISPKEFADKVHLNTGNANNIKPCSAVLHVDANYPWFVNINDIYILISTEPFNIPINKETNKFKGNIISCSRMEGNFDDYQIYCNANGLNSNTTYYYQMVRIDPSNSKVIQAGETKSFKTSEVTAKITTSISKTNITSANVDVTFTPGNLAGLYTKDNSNTTGGRMICHMGKSLKDLENSTGILLNSDYTNVFYPCYLSELDASTKYYYRCDFYIGEGLMCSSEVQEFTTVKSTATLKISNTEVFDTHAMIRCELDKGNTKNIISSSGTNTAQIKLFCGESKNEMPLISTDNAYSNNDFCIGIVDLQENKKYYYKVVYYAGNSILSQTDILEFTTRKSSDITNLGSLDVETMNSYSSSHKYYTLVARKGSVIAFKYTINQGGHSLSAQLSGRSSITLLNTHGNDNNWKSGSIYYVFTEAGSYTLDLSYSLHKYGHIQIPAITFIY